MVWHRRDGLRISHQYITANRLMTDCPKRNDVFLLCNTAGRSFSPCPPSPPYAPPSSSSLSRRDNGVFDAPRALQVWCPNGPGQQAANNTPAEPLTPSCAPPKLLYPRPMEYEGVVRWWAATDKMANARWLRAYISLLRARFGGGRVRRWADWRAEEGKLRKQCRGNLAAGTPVWRVGCFGLPGEGKKCRVFGNWTGVLLDAG